MPIGDFEAELRNPRAKRDASAWASVWWDLRTAAQILHTRSQLPIGAYESAFTRRAMIDGAIVTYGRAFVGGARHDIADAYALVTEMGERALQVHDEAMRWRHRHVAHRVEADWEHSDVRLLWGAFGELAPTFRIRLVTALGPDNDFAAELGEHSKALADRVWENRLIPIKDRYFASVDRAQLATIKSHHAAPYTPPPQPQGTIGVELDIGSEPGRPGSPDAPSLVHW
jgi:hypothetical protein